MTKTAGLKTDCKQPESIHFSEKILKWKKTSDITLFTSQDRKSTFLPVLDLGLWYTASLFKATLIWDPFHWGSLRVNPLYKISMWPWLNSGLTASIHMSTDHCAEVLWLQSTHTQMLGQVGLLHFCFLCSRAVHSQHSPKIKLSPELSVLTNRSALGDKKNWRSHIIVIFQHIDSYSHIKCLTPVVWKQKYFQHLAFTLDTRDIQVDLDA